MVDLSAITRPVGRLVATAQNGLEVLRYGGLETGAVPLVFQWRYNGTNIPGATDRTYTRYVVQVGEVGPFSVVVSNPVGTATSGDASLTIWVPPVIVTQPGSKSQQNAQRRGFDLLYTRATLVKR